VCTNKLSGCLGADWTNLNEYDYFVAVVERLVQSGDNSFVDPEKQARGEFDDVTY
jgi:hypothetical protein